jgi:lysozyme
MSPTMQNASRVSTLIRQNEGMSKSIYRDTRGNKTIGIGANISDPSVAALVHPDVVSGKRQMTDQEAQSLNAKQVQIAHSDAVNFVTPQTFAKLDSVRQAALVDISFNLGGPRLSKFVKFNAAMQTGDYKTAAQELLNSAYARQLPERAKRNAIMILQGEMKQ